MVLGEVERVNHSGNNITLRWCVAGCHDDLDRPERGASRGEGSESGGSSIILVLDIVDCECTLQDLPSIIILRVIEGSTEVGAVRCGIRIRLARFTDSAVK